MVRYLTIITQSSRGYQTKLDNFTGCGTFFVDLRGMKMKAMNKRSRENLNKQPAGGAVNSINIRRNSSHVSGQPVECLHHQLKTITLPVRRFGTSTCRTDNLERRGGRTGDMSRGYEEEGKVGKSVTTVSYLTALESAEKLCQYPIQKKEEIMRWREGDGWRL